MESYKSIFFFQVMRPEDITLREVYGRIDPEFDLGFGEISPEDEREAEVEMSVLRDSAASEQLREARDQSYKTFCGHNLQIFVIS
jgi:hypothetical protein